MTLEKHIIDTMKEWQIKIGSLESDIRLYYPKASLCSYLHLDTNTDNDKLCGYTEKYFEDHAAYLGKVKVSANQDRFCILVSKIGCDYVEKTVPEPEFLTCFLEVLKCQKMQSIFDYFEEYASKHGTSVCVEQEKDELDTVIYFEDETVEPYVYCIDQNEFGITYHRFTRGDYLEL